MKTKELLDRYAQSHQSFRVAFQWTGTTGKKFWKYLDYPTEESRSLAEKEAITDREILKDEIVIESDMNLEPANRSVSKQICKVLRKRFNYKRHFSGNKSYHIHMFFPELMTINDDKDRMLLKKLFIRWVYACPKDYMNCSRCDMVWGYKEDGTEIKCALIKHKIDMHLTGKHLIRIEGIEHPTTGVKKRLVGEYNGHPFNRLPEEVWNKFNKIKSMKPKHSKRTTEFHIKPCVDLLLTSKLEDGKQRAAFIVYNNLKKKYGPKKAEEELKAWHQKFYANEIDDNKIDSVIYHGKQSDQAPGCDYTKSVLREVGIKCPCEKK